MNVPAADRWEISIARVFFGGPELDPFLELPVGLLGEGEGDEGGGLDSLGQKTHGALRQDLCLPGARAGPFIDVLKDRGRSGRWLRAAGE